MLVRSEQGVLYQGDRVLSTPFFTFLTENEKKKTERNGEQGKILTALSILSSKALSNAVKHGILFIK